MKAKVFQLLNALVLILALQLGAAPLYACKTTIHIRNQADFDRLQDTFDKAVESGRNDIRIQFAAGEYVAKENHLMIKGIDNPNLRVRIRGNGAVLVPQGKVYRNGDAYMGTFSVENSWISGEVDINIWSRMREADGLIEVVDEGDKVCRIKSKEQLPANANFDNAYIMIPQSYLSYVYKITKTQGQYIYFTASNLAKRGSSWNINHDYHFGRAAIRFKTCNFNGGDDLLMVIDGKVWLPKGVSSVREGTTHRYIAVENCSLKEFSLSGLKIVGGRNVSGGATICFDKMKSGKCLIRDCVFEGLRSDVIRVQASQYVAVEGNEFKDCYMYGVYSDNLSEGTRVIGNTFENTGKAMKNTLCVACKGVDFEIRDNVLKDFGYGGIGAGVWYLSKKTNACTGVIEGNELYYTEEYIAEKQQHGLMDAGAIYLWTKNDGVSVRNNYIHDIDGMSSNRGIFCDDGAYNFEIIGNVVVRINNSNCIDSRLVSDVEETQAKGSGIEHSNVNITIRDNIIDGNIKFVGNATVADNRCVLGTNYYLSTTDGQQPANDIQNVRTAGKCVSIRLSGYDGGKIEVDEPSEKLLRKSGEWKSIRKRVKLNSGFRRER